MNDYLEIFSDVVLLATFQPRGRASGIRRRLVPARSAATGLAQSSFRAAASRFRNGFE